MTDWSELKRLAEAAVSGGMTDYPIYMDGPGETCALAEYTAENATLLLELISENEALRRQEIGLREMLRRQNKVHCRLSDEVKQLKKSARND